MASPLVTTAPCMQLTARLQVDCMPPPLFSRVDCIACAHAGQPGTRLPVASHALLPLPCTPQPLAVSPAAAPDTYTPSCQPVDAPNKHTLPPACSCSCFQISPGIMGPPNLPNGEDRHLWANHLGPYLLTRLLLPSFAQKGRVVNVSSRAHYWGNVFVKARGEAGTAANTSSGSCSGGSSSGGRSTGGSGYSGCAWEFYNHPRHWLPQYARSKLCNVVSRLARLGVRNTLLSVRSHSTFSAHPHSQTACLHAELLQAGKLPPPGASPRTLWPWTCAQALPYI